MQFKSGQKTQTLHAEVMQTPDKHMKRYYDCPLRKTKLKSQVISLHTYQNGEKKMTVPAAGRDTEQMVFLHITDGNAKIRCLSRKQLGCLINIPCHPAFL